MNKPIKMQTINSTEGTPLFVVIPYQDYLHWYEKTENLIPHEVVSLMVQKQLSPLRAWREYLKLTLTEVAERIGISEAALAQLETGEVKWRKNTLRKVAEALNITLEQLNV
jgi:DNA-binding XRE family transcriptional regulator